MVNPEIAEMPPEVDPILGCAIRTLREERGLNVNALEARSPNLESGALAQIENGSLDPQWSTVEAIAIGLGVTSQEIADAAERLRLNCRGRGEDPPTRCPR